jgi:hypothetical protein
MKGCGDNTEIGCLQLNAPEGSLLNCFGIQPIFHKDGFIEKSSLYSVYHRHNKKNPIGLTRCQMKIRKNENNNCILKNAFHYRVSDYEVVQTLLKNSDHYEMDQPLSELIQNKKLLKEKILYQATYIKARTNYAKANFFISSNKELLDTLTFKFTELIGLKKYLVSESLLPKNLLILGLRENTNYANSIIACPILDKKDFDEVCRLNGVDIYNMRPNYSKKYPLLERELDRYEIYQEYINHKLPEYWYIETFNLPQRRVEAPYITIHFT